MNIKCEAENYNYKIINDKVVFYNEFYNNGLLKLFLGAFADLCLPNKHSFDLPIGIEAKYSDNITLNKNLKIIGSDDYTYFVPVEHYKKWKKTYAVVYWCIIALELLISAILAYIFIGPANYNWIVVIPLIVVLSMCVWLIRKFCKQLKKAKRYQRKNL